MFKKALASALIAVSLSMVAFSSHAFIREGRVVYDDGTSQSIYPSVLYPQTFIQLAYGFSGVQSVIYNVDGTYSLVFNGANYLLLPTFDTTTRGLDPWETVAPSITQNPDGSITYTVQDGNLLVSMVIVISYM